MLLFQIILVFCIALTAFAAFSDARTFKIPNWISLLLILLYPVAVIFCPEKLDWVGGIMAATAILVVGFILFATRILGAGDVKFLTALGLWSGTALITPFLFSVAMAGGVLVVVMFIGAVIRNRGKKGSFLISFRETAGSKIPVPYGVAIAIGSTTIFYQYAMLAGLI